MQEHWTSTLDTREAAACGTLGIPAKLELTIIAATGKSEARFHLGLTCAEQKYQTKAILKQWRNGSLQTSHPVHPFLTIQRAYHNRLMVLDLQMKGNAMQLVPIGQTGLWQYAASNTSLPGLPPAPAEIIRTSNLKLVAALGVCGFPLLRIDGSGHQHSYYLPRYGPLRADGPPLDSNALRAAWHEDMDSIPWESPFAQAMRGLYNRERFLDAVNRSVPLILMQKPRSQKAAYVKENASDAALDLVKRHFDT